RGRGAGGRDGYGVTLVVQTSVGSRTELVCTK
ncbi:MAG: hypothetical protein QOJ25_2555, partial [Solirubrobacteraceae bacterium]|nr:hypothetical protein [Solirubrobacteraceae bacterium]